MQTFWSSQKESPLQKLVYEATFPQAIQQASTRMDHVLTWTKTSRKSVNRQQTHRGEGNNHIDASSSEQLAPMQMDKPNEFAAVYTTDKAMLQGSATNPLHFISTSYKYSAPYWRFYLQRMHRNKEWKMIWWLGKVYDRSPSTHAMRN